MHRGNFCNLVENLNKRFKISEPQEFQDYVVNLLKKEFVGYNKSKFRVSVFMPLINIAIANEKMFTKNVVDLKKSLGTNVGLLIQEMRMR